MLNADSKIARSEGMVEAEIDGETVMMSVEQGSYYGLDSIASRIWALIESPKSIREICEQLVLEYEVEMDQCQDDVMGFLHEMAERKVIQLSA